MSTLTTSMKYTLTIPINTLINKYPGDSSPCNNREKGNKIMQAGIHEIKMSLNAET